MTEEPITYYASRQDATKEAARRVAAGAKAEDLAIVCTVFGIDSARWFVRNVTGPAGAASLRQPYIDIKKLNGQKRAKLWYTGCLACILAFGGTFTASALLVALRIPNWIIMPMCICIAAGLTKGLFWLLAPCDIFEPVAGFDCTHENCRKYIATYDPWICGHCDAVNTPARKKTGVADSGVANWLAQACHKCSYPPLSYLCHHCGEIIFLTSERIGQHPARAANKIYLQPTPPRIREIQQVSPMDEWKMQTESQIEAMIAEKLAFSTITQKVCGLRDAEIRRIDDDQTIDMFTKNQLKEFEKQWANKKLLDLKTRAAKVR